MKPHLGVARSRGPVSGVGEDLVDVLVLGLVVREGVRHQAALVVDDGDLFTLASALVFSTNFQDTVGITLEGHFNEAVHWAQEEFRPA